MVISGSDFAGGQHNMNKNANEHPNRVLPPEICQFLYLGSLAQKWANEKNIQNANTVCRDSTLPPEHMTL